MAGSLDNQRTKILDLSSAELIVIVYKDGTLDVGHMPGTAHKGAKILRAVADALDAK